MSQTLQEWGPGAASATAKRHVDPLHADLLHLWKEKNARVFDRASATPLVVLGRIKEDVDLWVAAGARELGRLVCE
jgi:hypothetical protein